MPARISRANVAGTRPSRNGQKTHKNSSKRQRRTLDAYSIASKQEPETTKLQKHRLGEIEGDAPQRKRQRLEDEEEVRDDGHGQEGARRSQHRNGRLEDLEIEEGSDSEGNEWKMGGLGSGDEDSDIDSEEAFGASDEERFEGFVFRGSTSDKRARREQKESQIRPEPALMDLDEDDEGPASDDDSFGEEGVDLAAMLDEDSEDEKNAESHHHNYPSKLGQRDGIVSNQFLDNSPSSKGAEFEDEFHSFESASEEPSEQSDVAGNGIWDSEHDDDEEESISDDSDGESDENDPEKLQQLQDVVSSVSRSQGEATSLSGTDSRSQAQRMLQALQGMSGLDPALSRSAKKLAENFTSTNSKKDDLVRAPLPKRQQNMLDRTAAYKTAKDTLGRWIDTVKHNRRADHLVFPLKDPEAQEARGASRLVTNEDMQPQTELESTIQSILEESGLASKGGKTEEEKIREFEELEANKLPFEEVLARRAELRKHRELLFREEIRARRIKKIKSKAYRRVHRRERERDVQKQRSLLIEEGIDPSEDEKEANDRRRAEERMGARHRESRWAKSMKHIGRTVWDDEARSGVIDMALRNEQLRKRIEGKNERNEGESTDDESDDTPLDLERRLQGVEKDFDTEKMSGLHSMKFMQRAEANQKQINDETIQRIRNDLAEEHGDAEEDSETEVQGFLGRKTFGPTKGIEGMPTTPNKIPRNDFEEEEGSENEYDQAEDELLLNPVVFSKPVVEEQSFPTSKNPQGTKSQLPFQGKSRKFKDSPHKDFDDSGETSHEAHANTKGSVLDQSRTVEKNAPLESSGWTQVQLTNGTSDETHADEIMETETPIIPSDAELIKAAFGGDDVEADFKKEKKALMEDEDDKVTDNALPGWGSWVGDGVGKRELNRNKGKFITVEKGIKPSSRKDAKLEKAIISEKRVKKNAKYLASTLPHPFESRQQYERALRIPIGPEWTTKETFQKATKPRIIVKQGIIKPMERPLL